MAVPTWGSGEELLGGRVLLRMTVGLGPVSDRDAGAAGGRLLRTDPGGVEGQGSTSS